MPKLTILHILTFLSTFCVLLGLWQFAWIVIHRKGYELEKQDDESFMDFMFRYYADEWQWKLRKRYGPKWFYYSKMFLIFTKIKGVILIVVGLAIAFGVFFLSGTDLGVYLQIEI